MANLVTIDIDKVKALIPWLMTVVLPKIMPDGDTPDDTVPVPEPPDYYPVPEPTEPTPEPTVPPTSSEKLTGYLWEDSDQLIPGKAIVIPPKEMTGTIQGVYVGEERFTFHSVWTNGREIWYGTDSVNQYGGEPIRVVTDTLTYVDNAPDASDDADTSVPSSATEALKYWGRYNGDRPTWYGALNMSQYPSPMRVVIPGCLDKLIAHDGKRYDDGSLIVKQSDVSGRGLAVVYSASCKGKVCYLEY